eukprot:TRINITY_DN15732_c0_g1_i7.p2 TRINITY_DN15732_c0_g1~~TRINITY_DN15732_c0_g1_i7.p2  ORF type:complete len:100 (+),score=31.88 TRINITY_DN15732_c0_g1_i7:195-494(+)
MCIRDRVSTQSTGREDCTMRLLTHNMLESPVKGVSQRFPLGIEADQTEVTEQEFNPEFISHMFPRIDWDALLAAAQALKIDHGLPGACLLYTSPSPRDS